MPSPDVDYRADLLTAGGVRGVRLDEAVQGFPDLFGPDRQFRHRLLFLLSLFVMQSVCAVYSCDGARRPNSRRASASRARTVPSMISSPSSTRTPPSTVGSITSCTATSRPTCLLSAACRRVTLLARQRPGHPDRGHHAVLGGAAMVDVALDRLRERPVPGSDRTLRASATVVVSDALPSSSSPTSVLRRSAGPTARPKRVAQLWRGLHQPGEAEQRRPRSPRAAPTESAFSSSARTACRSSAAAKVRPPAQRIAAPSATTVTADAETFRRSRPCTEPACGPPGTSPGRSARDAASTEDSSASTTAKRSAARVSLDEPTTPWTTSMTLPSTPWPVRPRAWPAPRRARASNALIRASDPVLTNTSPVRLAGPADADRHDLPAGSGSSWASRSAMNRSTVRRARSSSSSDSPTIRAGKGGGQATDLGPQLRHDLSPLRLELGLGRGSDPRPPRPAPALASRRGSGLPWVFASSRILAASLRASASCALYCSSAACRVGLGPLRLLDAALDRLGALGVRRLEPRHDELGDEVPQHQREDDRRR